MRVDAQIRDSNERVVIEEVLEISSEPLYGRDADEQELFVRNYVENWAKGTFRHPSYEVIDPSI